MTVTAREGLEVLATLAVYEARVRPAARDQLRRWLQQAGGIPDPDLRRAAVSALRDKAANAEATAVLATLAPRRTRGRVLRASVALQVAVDYLDSLGEQAGSDALRDGLQLHLALGAALDPGAERLDWYRHHPRRSDGGYLDRLVSACQIEVATLPAREAILVYARRAAARCGEGQSHTHASAHASGGELEAWAETLGVSEPLHWWEVAAGASSSVATHALLALAGDPDATVDDAVTVDEAYFPSIGALTVLLDDLVDSAADDAAGEHNYLRYYADEAIAERRLVAIAEDARARTGALRHSLRHRAILTGVVAFYLGSAGTDAPLEPEARRRLLSAAGPTARPLSAFLRRRR
jgi:tetraprenyl-beta-curcumene synthase